jgi:nucleoside phosphorylase
MRILVTFAVDAEFAPWRKRHSFVAFPIELKYRYFKETFYKARVGAADVTVYLTGIGWTLPEYGLNMLLADKPAACISSGLAGGLKPSLKKGDIVAARFVGSLYGGGHVGANSKLIKVAEECGAKIVNTCTTSRQVVGQAQFKRAMGEFSDIVEMESFKIMSAVTGPQIPAITIRAISDTVDEDLLLDFSRVLDQSGRVLKRQLALQLARYPHQIPALIRFGRESQRAAGGLADFLDRYLEALDASGVGIPDMREQVAAK